MGANETHGVIMISETGRYFYSGNLVVGSVFNDAAADFGVVDFAGILVHGGAGGAKGEAILKIVGILVAHTLNCFEIVIA